MRVCVRLILVLVWKTLILVLVWGTYYVPAINTYVPGISRQTTVWYQVPGSTYYVVPQTGRAKQDKHRCLYSSSTSNERTED